LRRTQIARDSWVPEYKTGRWIPVEFTESVQTRSAVVVGDPHALPFVQDVIWNAMKYAFTENDIIAVTNADVGFAPGLTGRILDVVGRHGAAYAHRFDFKRLDAALVHDGQIRSGEFYPGSDAFFFTKSWWRDHGKDFGDYIWGREHWDEALRQLIKYYGGAEIRPAIYH
jgi:hypothetical protein